MKFSLWNFKDWFETKGISLSYRISDNEACIEQIQIGPYLHQTLPGTAFITDGSSLSDCTGFRSALCFHNDRLLFPTASVEQILNLGLNMMEHYNSMEESFYEEIFSIHNITDLLEKAADITGFPFAYLYANSSGFHHSSKWNLTMTDILKKNLIGAIKKTKAALPVYYFSNPGIFSGTMIAKALESNNVLQGYALLYDSSDLFKPGDMHLFSMTADIVKEALLFQDKHTTNNRHPLSEYYHARLLGQHNTKPADTALLEQAKWKPDDYFQIACIAAGNTNNIGFSDLVHTISDTNLCCIMTPNGLSILIHLGSEYPDIAGGLPAMLDSFCAANRLRAGYSLPFRTLDNVREFHMQAVYTLNLKTASSKQTVRTSSFLSDLILNKCKSLPDTQAYIHPDIQLLADIEEKDQEPLLETLYTYLILGRSSAHAAQAMFIHRNTLRARLEKIQRLISFSIEEYSDIEHILVSLLISKIPDRMY